jgi:hypothetical protein
MTSVFPPPIKSVVESHLKFGKIHDTPIMVLTIFNMEHLISSLFTGNEAIFTADSAFPRDFTPRSDVLINNS